MITISRIELIVIMIDVMIIDLEIKTNEYMKLLKRIPVKGENKIKYISSILLRGFTYSHFRSTPLSNTCWVSSIPEHY
jgi:hypothetical protein